MTLDVAEVRSRFPALARREHGRPVAWLDGPAGTQVPSDVIDALGQVLRDGIANLGGHFSASGDAAALVTRARQAAADLLGATENEIVFGPNMTTLTFAASRAIAREWGRGDRIVVTTLDHDANVTPWILAARDTGADVVEIEFDGADGSLSAERVADAIDERTRLVAVTAASNALGSITDVGPIVAAARRHGAMTFVDAVHHNAHRLSDVADLQPDFLVSSAYKFFGPHVGILYGRAEHLERLRPYKVRPAPEIAPDRWETGTQQFELLAGVTATVDYLASLGSGQTRRLRLESAFEEIRAHEEALMRRFLDGLGRLDRVRLYGPSDPSRRVSTFAVAVEGVSPSDVATTLAARGIHVWDGHYYAVGVFRQLGLLDSGGLVRIGFVHYSTPEEVDRVLEALGEISPD